MGAAPQMVAACRVVPAATPMPEWLTAGQQAVLPQAVVLQPVSLVVPTPADLR